MRKLIQSTLLAIFLLSLGVSTALAQNFTLLADSNDLDDGSGNTGFECVSRVSSSGLLVGYNEGAQAIVTYNADTSTLDTLRSPSEIQSDISSATPPIDACDAVTVDESDNLFFSLRDDNNDSYIYRVNASGSDNSVVVQALNGSNSMEATSSYLFVGIVGQFNQNFDNGIYRIPLPLTGSDSPTPVLNGSSVSNIVMDAAMSEASNGDLFLVTNESTFGISDNTNSNKVFQVADPGGQSPSVSEFADPIANGPLADGELLHIELVNFNSADRIVVSNNSFGASDGEQFGAIQSDGSVSVLSTASDIQSNTSVSDFAPMEDGGFVLTSSGEIITSSVDGGNFGEAALVEIAGTGLPVEMAGFDAAKNGSSVELTWQTASETNNAGFTVQRETESGWTSLDFVESKVAGGTTTETTSYRYTVQQELDPGTHRFRLEQKDLDGSTSLSDAVTVEIGLNEALTLQSPMPNPTRTQATVEFGVKKATETSVAVYNVLGQRVKTLYQGTPQANQMRDVTFNAGSLPSGVYFVRMQADGQTRTERLTVVR